MDALDIQNAASVGSGKKFMHHNVKENLMALRRKLNLELFCSMNLHHYPFDHNSCRFRIKSFSNNFNEIRFQLKHNFTSHIIDGVKEYETVVEHLDETEKLIKQDDENFALSGFVIKFKRNSFAIVVSLFLPSGILIIISWMRYVLSM